MRIAFIIYEGMTALDFVGIYDPLTRLKTMGFKDDLEWEICALSEPVHDISGLRFTPTRVNTALSEYDLLVVPGGSGSRKLAEDREFIGWLRTGASSPLIVSVCTGSLLLGAAGFLNGKRATTHPEALADLKPYCAEVSSERIVDEGEVITAGGVTSAIDLGLFLVQKLAGTDVRQKIQQQMAYTGIPLTPGAQPPSATTQRREARLSRYTKETRIDLLLSLDGAGSYQITTGIGFLDHMLTHLAVHGFFDLTLKAEGDLIVDVHHTVEDVALALGQAFAQSLGDRQGIRRMASAYVPMDEALAFVAVDLSGRPYAVMEMNWNGPEVGGIPTSLFPHFFESFAVASRCNLHARLISGRDDHHRAEALFKALARALDAATQIDPRLGAAVPSTKGTLTL